MSEKIIIFDTTLRDGEQCPGASMTSEEKMEIAHALARLRVDVIEAGFPIASPDDLAAVRRIANEVGCRGTARTRRRSVAWRAARRRISTRPGKRFAGPTVRGSTFLSPRRRFI